MQKCLSLSISKCFKDILNHEEKLLLWLIVTNWVYQIVVLCICLVMIWVYVSWYDLISQNDVFDWESHLLSLTSCLLNVHTCHTSEFD